MTLFTTLTNFFLRLESPLLFIRKKPDPAVTQTADHVLLHTDFPGLPLHASGKVRDVYALNGNLVFVATDRISAFDYVLATGIPHKGRVLNQLSLFWFEFLKDIVPNHLLPANVD